MDKANQSIKSVNASLSSMAAPASKSPKGVAQGFDGMTAAMVKGATAGSLFADASKGDAAEIRKRQAGVEREFDKEKGYSVRPRPFSPSDALP